MNEKHIYFRKFLFLTLLSALVFLAKGVLATTATVGTTAVPDYAKHGYKFSIFELTVTVGNDQVLVGTTITAGTLLTSTNPWNDVYFVDNGDNIWEEGSDTLFKDNGKIYYDSGEQIIAGTTLSENTELTFWNPISKPWNNIFFVDDNTAGWNPSLDAVVKVISGTASSGNILSDTLTLNSGDYLCYYDDSNNGKIGNFDENYDAIWIDDSSCQYGGGEIIVAGSTPSSGTSGSTTNPFSDILFVDDGTAGWDSNNDAVVKVISGTASSGNILSDTLMLTFPNQLAYYDSGISGTWESDSDAIVIDDGKVKYDSGEQVLRGTTPAENTVAQHDNPWTSEIKFYDASTTNPNNWDETNDAIIYDDDNNDYYLDKLQSVIVENTANGDGSKVFVALHKQNDCSGIALGTSSYGSGKWTINVDENLYPGDNTYYVCVEVVTTDDTGTQVQLAMENNAITLTSGASNTAGGSVSFMIDNTPPTVQVSIIEPTFPDYTKSGETLTISIEITDETEESLDTTTLSVDCSQIGDSSPTVVNPLIWDGGNNKWIVTYTCTVGKDNPVEDGSKTISVSVQDKAGNQGSESDTTTVDNTPPTIDSFSPSSKTWTNQDVSVTILANDGTGSGVQAIYYKVVGKDETCPTPNPGSDSYTQGSSVTIGDDETDGEYKICAYVVDNVNNYLNLATESGIYQIDKTNPIVGTVTVTPIYDDGTTKWVPEQITISAPVNDVLSGIDACKYTTDGGLTWNDATYNSGVCTADIFLSGNTGDTFTVNIRAIDQAGNEAQGTAVTVTLDKDAPSVSFDPNSQTWTNTDITVTISASDSGSDVAGIYYTTVNYFSSCPSVGDISYQSVTGASATVTMSDEGEWKICAYAIDKVGNIPGGVSESGAYQIDKTKPTTTASATANGNPYTSNTWINADVTVTLTASDPHSGVAETKYVIEDGEFDCSSLTYDDLINTYSSSISIAADPYTTKQQTICFASKDNVGNIEDIQAFVVKIDKEPPERHFDPPYDQYNPIVNNLGTISVQITDGGSGVSQAEVLIYSYSDYTYWDGTQWKNYETWLSMTYNSDTDRWEYDASGVSLEDEKTYNIMVRATDNVGESSATSKDVKADLTPPTISGYYIHNITHDGKVWIGGDYDTVEVNASDNIGPIKYLIYLDSDSTCSAPDDWSDCGTLVAELSDYTTETSVELTLGQETTEAQNGWNSITSGDYHIHIIVEDKAGNVYIRTEQAKVDKDVPTATFTYTDENGNSYTPGNWISKNVTVIVNVDDGTGIGVNRTLYKIVESAGTCPTDITAYTELTGDVVIPEEGEWKICAYAIDTLGNNQIAESGAIQIDKTPPTITIDGIADYVNSEPTIQLTVNDGRSGIQTVEILIKDNTTGQYYDGSNWVNSGTWITLTSPYTYDLTGLLTDGHTYVIRAKAIDNAGNEKEAIPEIFTYDISAPTLQKAIQLNLTHVKLVFSEYVKASDEVSIIVNGVNIWDDGTITTDTATITCNTFNQVNEVICEIDKPLTEGASIQIPNEITDLAGNALTGTPNLENPSDILFKIPADQWIYIALEYEPDKQYVPFNDFLTTVQGTVLTYMGNWTTTSLTHPLLGYVIKIKSGDSSIYYLPVRYRDTLSEDAKSVVLAKGWNLIAVMGDLNSINNNIDTFTDASITSLESLTTSYGLRYYKFAWIVNELTDEYKSGNNIINVNSWIEDYTPYWVYMLEESRYSTPATPSP